MHSDSSRLVRGIDRSARKQDIVCATVRLCSTLGVGIIAEAVETAADYAILRACGISLMQGLLFARPTFEALPKTNGPTSPRSSPLLLAYRSGINSIHNRRFFL